MGSRLRIELQMLKNNSFGVSCVHSCYFLMTSRHMINGSSSSLPTLLGFESLFSIFRPLPSLFGGLSVGVRGGEVAGLYILDLGVEALCCRFGVGHRRLWVGAGASNTRSVPPSSSSGPGSPQIRPFMRLSMPSSSSPLLCSFHFFRAAVESRGVCGEQDAAGVHSRCGALA
jgi:hypothetical protein